MSPSLEDIAAITFDVGGTLIEPWPSVGHVYAEVAAKHGVDGISVERLDQQFAESWKSAREFNYTEAAWANIVDATFHGLCRAVPSQTFFPELYRKFSEPDAWH